MCYYSLLVLTFDKEVVTHIDFPEGDFTLQLSLNPGLASLVSEPFELHMVPERHEWGVD